MVINFCKFQQHLEKILPKLQRFLEIIFVDTTNRSGADRTVVCLGLVTSRVELSFEYFELGLLIYE